VKKKKKEKEETDRGLEPYSYFIVVSCHIKYPKRRLNFSYERQFCHFASLSLLLPLGSCDKIRGNKGLDLT
jgi:hypothetical protein